MADDVLLRASRKEASQSRLLPAVGGGVRSMGAAAECGGQEASNIILAVSLY